ncbi:MAG: TetR/AcrR family transcriptional regulator [Fimbriiglobus sp.]
MTTVHGESPTETPTEPRLRLLDAALTEFAEQGFTAASVRDICKRAGMNVAAVNYYFGDKERLYTEAVNRAHVCADGPDTGPPEWPAGTPPVEKLRGFIRMMAGKMHAPAEPRSLQLLMRELAVPSAAGAAVIREYIQPKAFGLRAVLQELMPGDDPRRLLMIGFSVMGQLLFYRQNRAVVELMFGKDAVDALGLELVTDHVTRFTLAALGHAEPILPGNPV